MNRKLGCDGGGRTQISWLAYLVIPAAVALTACGGSGSTATAQIATISTSGGADDTTVTTEAAKDRNQALLDFAKCMRENGVEMADPTFDADGNVQGGGFGAPPGQGGGTGDGNSAFDPSSAEFQTAIGTCGELIQGVGFGGAGGTGGPDRDGIQNALTDFTACLRDNGQDVDDITFGGPGGGQAGAGGRSGAGGGQVGGFGGPPPSGAPNGGGPGGQGFNPVDRMIEQLGLDESDPAVVKALEACQPILDDAFSSRQDAPSTTEA